MEVVMQRKNPVTRKVEEKQLRPGGSLKHFFSHCYSFDLSLHAHDMRRLGKDHLTSWRFCRSDIVSMCLLAQ